MENKYFNDYLDNTNDRAIEYDNGNSQDDNFNNAVEEYLYDNWNIINQGWEILDKFIDDINKLNEEDPNKEIDDNMTVGDLVNDVTVDFIVDILKIGFKKGYEQASK